MIIRTKLLGVVVGILALADSAAAQAPVAVVEDVNGKSAGVELMDYVQTGKVIRLDNNDTIVLSYIKSCVREAITGGTITIGMDQSDIQSGKVERTKVECDAGKMTLTAQQASQTATFVVRSLQVQDIKHTDPQFILYGSSPIFMVPGGGKLVIERLDKADERHVLTIGSKPQEIYDFANGSAMLTAGGIYKATANRQQIVFKIDPNAKSGRTPFIGRLIRLGPLN